MKSSLVWGFGLLVAVWSVGLSGTSSRSTMSAGMVTGGSSGVGGPLPFMSPQYGGGGGIIGGSCSGGGSAGGGSGITNGGCSTGGRGVGGVGGGNQLPPPPPPGGGGGGGGGDATAVWVKCISYSLYSESFS